MTYIDGTLMPVVTDHRADYKAYAEHVAALFKANGALELVDCWGDDVPTGKLNSFPSAVLLTPGETVVMSWIKWPSKEVRDKAWQDMDEELMNNMPTPPFDTKRMIYGGYDVILETSKGSASEGPACIEGMMVPAKKDARDAYKDHAIKAAEIFQSYGALGVTESWADDVPPGKLNSMLSAVLAAEDEVPVYSWIDWPSKDIRDAAWPKIMEAGDLMALGDPPFDMTRMIGGVFSPLVRV